MFTTDLRALIEELVVAPANKRLGSGSNTSVLRSHSVFKGSKWEQISGSNFLSPLLSVAANETALATEGTLNDSLRSTWEAPYVTFAEDGWENEIRPW